MRRDDERGQAIQIGAVLLFGALVIALAGYQAFVVPQQNEQVEFSHSQTVQTHLQDLRNAVVSMVGGGSPRSVSVQLGTRYPARLVTVNPGPPTGMLRTVGTDDASVAVTIDNARASGETGDFWTGGARTYPTGGLVYRPNYNVYGEAPTTVYENSVLYNAFPSGTVALTGQALVDGDRITLVALNGSVDETRSGTVSPDVRPVSSDATAVSVSDDGSPITLEVPTRLDEETWESLLADEMTPDGHVTSVSVTDVAGSEFDGLTITLERGQRYTLQLAKAGIGSRVSGTSEAYVTDAGGNESTVPEGGSQLLVVEVRDRFDNPVSGVAVSGEAVAGSLDDATARTGADGRATFLYQAPGSVDATTDASVRLSFEGPPGADYDPDAPENVTMVLDVQNTKTGGGGAGGVPYSVAWNDPDGGGDARYTLDVDAEGNTLDLTAVVQNTTLTNRTIGGAEVDFAVNDSTVGTVFPGNDTSGPAGKARTTLTANDNGVVRIYAVISGGASDYIDVEVTGADIPQPGVVFADPNNGELSTVDESGSIARSEYGVTDVQAAGPQTIDFAFGSGPEVPYVDGNGNLSIVHLGGNRRTLVDPDAYEPGLASDKRLAVGRVSVGQSNDYQTATGPFVYFVDRDDNLARVDADGNVDLVDGGFTAQAVAGTGDVDGDGTPELVYVDSDDQFAYLNDKGNGKAERVTLTGSPTLDTPNAVGEPADFDGDGADEIPYIDGSENVKYVNGDAGGDTSGSTTTVVGGAGGANPVGVADRDADGTPEIVYVDESDDSRLAYADPVGGTVFITDSNGNEIAAASGPGTS